eukprot:TRINITY_DN55668_c0_g1_i1.p1 TRINITY_DN55668_c0_g1~~TRINITY_DN55668_c0_g1_i1.p1  ORF type:complete len:300 (+),score=53.64 TRINITY_DN55668_c0_g1_i1:85-984(+)
MASPFPSVVMEEGEGGLQKVVMTHPSRASAEIYLWGATLTSYKSDGGTKENIFVSPGAVWDGKKAIRGGVPLVFPQFGQPDVSMPQHGFVRTSLWSVREVRHDDDVVTLKLAIRDNEATREKWAHAFALEYIVELREQTLSLCLRVENCGDAPFSYQALLHTYFIVPKIEEVVVRGLQGRTYIDKAAGGDTREESEIDVALPEFTDRVYCGVEACPCPVTVQKKDGTQLYDVVNSSVIGSQTSPCDVVVWNPYEAASPSDLPPPAFRNFVCVEPGLVAKSFGLPPGQTAEVAQVIRPIV